MNKFFTNKACPNHYAKRGGQGFMVIEILIAISIITASILATMAVAQKSVYVARQSLHAYQAAFLLEEGAEAVRLMRDDAWSNISSLTEDLDYFPLFTGSAWTLGGVSGTVGNFTRIVRVSSVERDGTTKDIVESGIEDPNTRLVTIEVSWNEGGVPVAKNLQFYIMNIFDDSAT